MSSSRQYDLTFFTATILEWKHLLISDEYKELIMDSLRFLVRGNRIQLNAFVIMNNHMHLIWHILSPFKPDKVQQSFLRFTAQNILLDLRNNNRELLSDFFVGAKDRKHQIWERNPLSIGLWTEEVLRQKLKYIHNNPVEAGYCLQPENYRFSSAAIYAGMDSEWSELVTPCFL
jgi:putative transposase